MSVLPEGFDLTGWPFLILGGLGLFYYLIFDPIFNKLSWTFYPQWSVKFQSIWPFIILLPLEKATQIAYTKLSHTTAADSADYFDNKEMDYFATYFATAEMSFYGKRNLSSAIDLIPSNDIKSGKFEGNTLMPSVDNKKPWVDIKIERNQLTKFIKERNEQ